MTMRASFPGYILERVSGKPLEAFAREVLFNSVIPLVR